MACSIAEREDLLVGNAGTGEFHLNGGTVTVARSGDAVFVGSETTGTGTLTIAGGTLNVPSGGVRVGRVGAAQGTVVQTDGAFTIRDNLTLASDTATTFGRYEMHGGSLTLSGTANGYMQVGRMGTGEFIQTGGAVTLNRDNNGALLIGSHAGGKGAYRISGGSLLVPSHILYVGLDGTGTLDVLGGAASIWTNRYSQNAASLLRTAIGNGGISTVRVGGTVSVASEARLDVDVYGGAALTTATTFDLLRSDTAGAISGLFTVVDVEPLWNVTQDGTVVRAAYASPGQGTVAAGYGVPAIVDVPGGAGSDWLTVTGVQPGKPLWVFLDVVDGQGDLDATRLNALADYLRTAGHTVLVDDPRLGPGSGNERFDLVMEFLPTAATSYFAWDFSDYDPQLLVTGLAVGVPEPATWGLLSLGLLGLTVLGRRWRRGS